MMLTAPLASVCTGRLTAQGHHATWASAPASRTWGGGGGWWLCVSSLSPSCATVCEPPQAVSWVPLLHGCIRKGGCRPLTEEAGIKWYWFFKEIIYFAVLDSLDTWSYLWSTSKAESIAHFKRGLAAKRLTCISDLLMQWILLSSKRLEAQPV